MHHVGMVKWEWNDVHGNEEKVGVVVPASVLMRVDLSCKAKMVFAYMFSKPAGYQFASKRMSKDFAEGYRTILAAIHELEEYGYVEKKRLADGRMFYELREDYSRMTEVEAKESLFEAYEDAFRRPVREYGVVTLAEAQEAIYGILGDRGKSWDSALDLLEQCKASGLGLNEMTLKSWLKHVGLTNAKQSDTESQ